LNRVKEISDLLIWLLRAGTGFRLVFCLLRLMGNEEEAQSYKKRAIHVVVFYILAESVWQIKNLIIFYLT
jgi:hypothetical protein